MIETNDQDNLEKIGKKMPYSMPEGLFERVQSNVLEQIDKMEKEKQVEDSQKRLKDSERQAKNQQKKTLIRRLTIAITAIAASVCAVCILHFGNQGDDGNLNKQQQQAANTTAVDKAYDNLSQEERENLLADYSNDIYMSLQ